MIMTLEQWKDNPMGRGNAMISSTTREKIRSDYVKRFDALMVRERGRVEYNLFKDTVNNKFYAYLKIPSEVVEKFYYDVVLEFSATSDIEDAGRNLMKYNVKFFANDPAFVFTYVRAYDKMGLFINELESKMARKALREASKVKNPLGVIGYVKSLYFAYLAMYNKGLLNATRFESEARDIDFTYLINHIEDADDKIRRRQEEGEKVQKRKSKARKDAKKITGNMVRDNNAAGNYIKMTSNVAKTGTINKSKRTKVSPKIKTK